MNVRARDLLGGTCAGARVRARERAQGWGQDKFSQLIMHSRQSARVGRAQSSDGSIPLDYTPGTRSFCAPCSSLPCTPPPPTPGDRFSFFSFFYSPFLRGNKLRVNERRPALTYDGGFRFAARFFELNAMRAPRQRGRGRGRERGRGRGRRRGADVDATGCGK